MIRYLVSKRILGLLYAHENKHFDNLFLTVLAITSALFLWLLEISHYLNVTISRKGNIFSVSVFYKSTL